MRLHESAADIGVVQQGEARLQFLFRLGNLQYQPLVRRRVTVNKVAVNRETPFAWEKVEQLSQRPAQHLPHRQD